MTIDSAVITFSGVFILFGMGLGWFVNPYFYLLPLFAGINLLQSGLTGFCPAAMIFKLMGLRPGRAFYTNLPRAMAGIG